MIVPGFTIVERLFGIQTLLNTLDERAKAETEKE
jgi:hypothetical protein